MCDCKKTLGLLLYHLSRYICAQAISPSQGQKSKKKRERDKERENVDILCRSNFKAKTD